MAAVSNKHDEVIYKLHTATAHDWEDQRRHKDLKDDGTMSFFWRAHTITVLVIFSCILVYVAVFENQDVDSSYNMKRGVLAMIGAFLLFGVIQTPRAVQTTTHPAFWRLVLCLSIVYELALVFLLFQNVSDARKALRHFDSSLGEPLPEKNYGGQARWICSDALFGWWLKTLILRDWWLCTVLSIMFEILEYTLEHQLPNFSECWWDHWIMDAIVCNGLGIYLGMKTLKYLTMKPYHWRGMWNIPTYSGKMKRVALQFTPYSWTDFDWKPTSSLKRWTAMLFIIAIFLLAELNTFYLKFVLWVPPEHYLCLGRLVFFLFMGAASMREAFQYLDDPTCKKFGRQSWLVIAVIITEFLITIRFDWETISKPLPRHISMFWSIGLVSLLLWTLWKFYIKKDVKHDIPEGDSLHTKHSPQRLQSDSRHRFANGSFASGEVRSRSRNGSVQRS
ncbi:hypothetical protein ScPMuIL_015916 [Solemya velum]